MLQRSLIIFQSPGDFRTKGFGGGEPRRVGRRGSYGLRLGPVTGVRAAFSGGCPPRFVQGKTSLFPAPFILRAEKGSKVKISQSLRVRMTRIMPSLTESLKRLVAC